MTKSASSIRGALRLGLTMLAFAGAAVVASAASASQQGTLVIKNDSKYYVTYYVPADSYWNCDDSPQRGFMVVNLAPGAESTGFTFLRTDGHGCNGRQGQFTMTPTLPNIPAQGQHFWFDGNGSLQLQDPQVNYLSRLTQRPGGVYVWTVTPPATGMAAVAAKPPIKHK